MSRKTRRKERGENAKGSLEILLSVHVRTSVRNRTPKAAFWAVLALFSQKSSDQKLRDWLQKAFSGNIFGERSAGEWYNELFLRIFPVNFSRCFLFGGVFSPACLTESCSYGLKDHFSLH